MNNTGAIPSDNENMPERHTLQKVENCNLKFENKPKKKKYVLNNRCYKRRNKSELKKNSDMNGENGDLKERIKNSGKN